MKIILNFFIERYIADIFIAIFKQIDKENKLTEKLELHNYEDKAKDFINKNFNIDIERSYEMKQRHEEEKRKLKEAMNEKHYFYSDMTDEEFEEKERKDNFKANILFLIAIGIIILFIMLWMYVINLP